jgi:hypothetical protein
MAAEVIYGLGFRKRPGSPSRLPFGLISGLFIASGMVLFALSYLSKSAPVTMFGAAITSLGIVAPPVELAVRGRLSGMHRGALLLGLVLIVQALHTVEHVVQLMEWYRLDRTGALSQGIVSQLNIEWVHFGWNWIAWLGVIVAWRAGVRGRWMIPLFVWITAHSLEHTYMLFHYLQIGNQLDRLGLPRFGASEVLPGVLGRDGWLSREFGSTRSWLGPLTAAPRTAIHFWWNIGELSLLCLSFFFRGPSASAPPVQNKPTPV